MSKAPIQVFESKEQFLACAKEWQEKLFLTDWFIKFSLTEEELKDDAGNLLWGFCQQGANENSAFITVYNKDDFSCGSEETKLWLKPCAELTLIHELLHLQFEYAEAITDEDNEILREHFTHVALERMAKSLLMAKYDLNKQWFFVPEDDDKDVIINLGDINGENT